MKISPSAVIAGIAILILAGVCVRLGFWQLDRLEQRRAFNSEVSAALEAPALKLDSATLSEIHERPHDYLYRRVTARGVYQPRSTVILRGRAHNGAPGVHLVTALQLATGDMILVNRGWIPSPDGATADPRPYTVDGVQHVEGTLQLLPDAGEEASPLAIPLADTTVSSYRRLDGGTMERELGTDLPPLYLQEESSGEETLPATVPPPTFDEGPHFGYAVQWFSFAAIALVGFLLLMGQQIRGGSREQGVFVPPHPPPPA